MVRSIRNLGRPGTSSMAIAAVDIALWDTKARCAGQPLFRLLGAVRDAVPVYGGGGFTTYSESRLLEQLSGCWAASRTGGWSFKCPPGSQIRPASGWPLGAGADGIASLWA